MGGGGVALTGNEDFSHIFAPRLNTFYNANID